MLASRAPLRSLKKAGGCLKGGIVGRGSSALTSGVRAESHTEKFVGLQLPFGVGCIMLAFMSPKKFDMGGKYDVQ